MTSKKFGWRPSLPDHRNYKFARLNAVRTVNPTSVDLRRDCPAVYDQGDLGSCTANASAGLYGHLLHKEMKSVYTPSRLFIYYNERVLEHTVNEDSGASMTDAMKVLAKQGAPHESLWWYNTKKFTVKPSQNVYKDGLVHRIAQYQSLNNGNLDELRSCLADGFPFIFGFTAYESLEGDVVAKTGLLPMPGPKEKVIGGHAVMAVGYSDALKSFLIRNSWGANWALKGYFWMPYSYVCNGDLADDFWTARLAN
jgi:C1A family cysteine protease